MLSPCTLGNTKVKEVLTGRVLPHCKLFCAVRQSLMVQSAVTTGAVFQQSATVFWAFLCVSAVPASPGRCWLYGLLREGSGCLWSGAPAAYRGVLCHQGAQSSDILLYVTLKGQKLGFGNPAPRMSCSRAVLLGMLFLWECKHVKRLLSVGAACLEVPAFTGEIELGRALNAGHVKYS